MAFNDFTIGNILIQIIISCFFIAFKPINAANILIMTPFFSRSHFAFNNAMAIDLLNAGHQITIVSSIPYSPQHKNCTMIIVPQLAGKSNQTNNLPVSEALQMSSRISMYDMLIAETEQDCYNVMQLQQMQEIMKSKRRLFDIMFIDLVPFIYECFLPISNALDIPVIGTIAARSWRNIEWIMGNPYNPATVPFELSDFSSEMHFRERLMNTWHCIGDHLYRHFYIRPRLMTFYDRHFGNLSMQSRQPSLVFVNGHSALMPRPLVPSIINVGGLHLPPVQPLPKDLKKFIDEAKDGVILFTVGSTLQSHMMPKDIIAVFRDVFAKIPQRVIWKSEEAIDDVSPNVLLSKWLPQRDILAHKNVVAFITHCGISGIYEAVDSSTPMILMPVIFDEMSNAAILDRIGAGIQLNMLSLEREELIQALKSIIYDDNYRIRMQEISLQFKDQPMTPHELVVYWTEYVLRHHGAQHLKTAAADLPLYQYLLLDVLTFVTFILIGSLLLLLTAAKCIVFFFSQLFPKNSNFRDKKNR